MPKHGFDRRSGSDGREGEGMSIKLYLGGKIYRFRAAGLCEVEQHVRSKLAQGGAAESGTFDLTYRDPQDDTITIADEDDLLEALHLMCVDGRGTRALKLNVEMTA